MGIENYFLTLWSVSVHAVCVCGGGGGGGRMSHDVSAVHPCGCYFCSLCLCLSACLFLLAVCFCRSESLCAGSLPVILMLLDPEMCDDFSFYLLL